MEIFRRCPDCGALMKEVTAPVDLSQMDYCFKCKKYFPIPIEEE